jgi:hypothetical protein
MDPQATLIELISRAADGWERDVDEVQEAGPAGGEAIGPAYPLMTLP